MKERRATTNDMKQKFRQELTALARAENLILTVSDSGGGGGGRQISMAVQGPSTDELIRLSDEILRRAPMEVPGALNLTSNMKAGKDEVQFVIDRRRAAEYGLSSQDIGRAIRGMYEGELAGKYREQGEEWDIRVRLPKTDRLGVSPAMDLTIPNSRDEAVPVSVVASPRQGRSPTSIVRINQARAALVEGDLDPGAPLGGVLTKLREVVTPLLKEGYRVDFLGQAKAMRDMMQGALVALGLGAVFVYMVMASLYESLIIPFSILLTLPLAMVGAIVALLVTGRFMDIYAVIGIILLMGLVTKNAILVVDYAEQLRRAGEPRYDALMKASLRRMRPIMMTSVAMIAGMLPVALGMSELNRARAGMGIGAVGGMISSTLLSLVVVPCAYIYLDDFREWAQRHVRRIWG
jgi:HAE1 family hydrophobic/amphiphilic exporter-1